MKQTHLSDSWISGDVPVESLRLGCSGNISTLAQIAGEQSMTVGFVVTGSQRRQVLVRAIGPSLTPFGVDQVLADPRIRVGSQLYDDWSAASEPEAATVTNLVGAFLLPTRSLDSVALLNLIGSSTPIVSNIGKSPGRVLLEVYDASAPASGSSLANLSVLHFANSDGGTLTAGFVLRGPGTAGVLIRVCGPALRPFGITDFLADPDLEVIRNGVVLYRNDDFTTQANGADIATVSARVGAFPLISDAKLDSGKDAAAYLPLSEGAYTVVVAPKAPPKESRAGRVLVELYVVP